MGGALALRLAEKHPGGVAGLILVNPAVVGYPNTRAIPLLSKVLPSAKAIGSDIAQPGVDEYSYERTPLRAAHSMLRLWADVRACLDLVTCPVLVYRSTTDHVVPAASTQYILSHISSEEVSEQLLHRSYHVATMDHDKEEIFAGALEFLQQHSA